MKFVGKLATWGGNTSLLSILVSKNSIAFAATLALARQAQLQNNTLWLLPVVLVGIAKEEITLSIAIEVFIFVSAKHIV